MHSYATQITKNDDITQLEKNYILKIKEDLKNEKEVENLLDDVLNIARTTTDTKRLISAFSRVCDVAKNKLKTELIVDVFYCCSIILYDFFVELEFQNLPSKKWSNAVLKSLNVLQSAVANLKSMDMLVSVKVQIILCFCSCAFQYSIKWHKGSRHSLEDGIELLRENFYPNSESLDLFGKACFCMGRQYEAIEQRLATEGELKDNERKTGCRSTEQTSSLLDNQISDKDTKSENSNQATTMDKHFAEMHADKSENLLKTKCKHECNLDDTTLPLTKCSVEAIYAPEESEETSQTSNVEVPNTPKEPDIILIDKMEIMKQIDNIIEVASRVSFAIFQIQTLLDMLYKACNLATFYGTPDEELDVFHRCSATLYRHLSKVDYLSCFTDEWYKNTLNNLEAFRNRVEKINAHTSSKHKKMKVYVSFYICTSAFQHILKRYKDSEKNMSEVKTLMKKNFGAKYKKMSLYGKLSFFMSEHFKALEQMQKCNFKLQESFDAFYGVNRLHSDDSSIAELYGIVLHVINKAHMTETKRLMKHVHDKLLARYQHPLKIQERFLLTMQLIWISQLRGDEHCTLGKLNGDLSAIDLPPPSKDLLDLITDVLSAVLSYGMISVEPSFKNKLIAYGKDAVLKNSNKWKKFYNLNILVVSVLDDESLHLSLDEFHLCLFQLFLDELEKERCSCEYNPWVILRLCSAHIYLCFYYAAKENYSMCIQHTIEAFDVLSDLNEESCEKSEILKATLHYISAFVYCRKRDYDQASAHLDNQITLLENHQQGYSMRLIQAHNCKAYVKEMLKGNQFADNWIPEGLEFLLPIFPLAWNV